MAKMRCHREPLLWHMKQRNDVTSRKQRAVECADGRLEVFSLGCLQHGIDHRVDGGILDAGEVEAALFVGV